MNILRGEWRRQARFYRIYLSAHVRQSTSPSSAMRQLADYLRLADQTTEFIWRHQLVQLRNSQEGKHHKGAIPGKVHTTSDVELPSNVEQVLSLGSKFAVQSTEIPAETSCYGT
ncbi:hypothetical protein MTO96_051796 [Rhipicephalus appendiculatus]